MSELDGLLERLLRANEAQAQGTGALVEIQRANADRLDTIEEHNREQTHLLGKMVERLESMETARDQAVNDVKAHVTAAVSQGFSSSEGWWRKAVWISTAVIGGATLLAPVITRLVEVVAK